MTKSKNGMVTRNNTQLATCTLPVVVIKITFLLLVLVRYLLLFTPVNSYLTRCSWENLIFATTSGNISVIRYGVSQVTIPLLDLLIFHWIKWIHRKSFRENSIMYCNVMLIIGMLQLINSKVISFKVVLLRYQCLEMQNSILDWVHDFFS